MFELEPLVFESVPEESELVDLVSDDDGEVDDGDDDDDLERLSFL